MSAGVAAPSLVWCPLSLQTWGSPSGPRSPWFWIQRELSSSHLQTLSPSSELASWTSLRGPAPLDSTHWSRDGEKLSWWLFVNKELFLSMRFCFNVFYSWHTSLLFLMTLASQSYRSSSTISIFAWSCLQSFYKTTANTKVHTMFKYENKTSDYCLYIINRVWLVLGP